MTSRNDPRRTIQRNPLDGIGAQNVPIINANVQNPSAPTKEELLAGDGLPDPGWTPGGAMMAVQIVQTASGETREGKVIIPDNVRWVSAVFVVLAVGPECKFFRRGDHVLVSPQVEAQVVRYTPPGSERHVSSMFIHEQQAFGYINEVREGLTKTETKEDEVDLGGEAGGA